MADESVPTGIPTNTTECLLPTLSAEEVHKNILRCHALRNRVDRRLLEWVHVLIEEEHWDKLGCSSAAHYVEKHLKYGKSEAALVVKAARNLPFLPRCLEAFEMGIISWSQLKQIGRVVKEETEGKWLSFALANSADMLKAEVKYALDNGRDDPREGSHGLPNTNLDMTFHLTREVFEIVRKAFEKKAAEMRAARGDEKWRPTPEEVLRALSEEILETEGAGAGESERKRAMYDIVYITCRVRGASPPGSALRASPAVRASAT